ncbi:MAG: tandem-95 repeat protein [Phycisphaerae bacterium]|nr:tandem-95 repeat protein [Phycisphaerae bacterium]
MSALLIIFITVPGMANEPGDFNGDGNIDLLDYAQFWPCLNGPQEGLAWPECDVFDFEPDNDVDLSDFAGFQLVFQLSEDPIADAGGPYLLNEGDVEDGVWAITLDGSGSMPGYVGDPIVTYRWDGVCISLFDTFDGTEIDDEAWYTQNAIQNGHLTVSGNGSWASGYAFSKQATFREHGFTVEARITPGSGDAAWGLKNDNDTNFSYMDMPHAIYFYNNYYKRVYIYENGSSQGYYETYSNGTSYEVRIDVKSTSGATYYIREVGAPEWTELYDSSNGDVGEFLVGLTVQSSDHIMDNVRVTNSVVYGQVVDCFVTGEAEFTLTVIDSVGRSDSDTVDVIIQGDSPIADADGPHTALHGTLVEFDGTGSADDVEIISYEWDFGDGTTGSGPMPTHRYPTSSHNCCETGHGAGCSAPTIEACVCSLDSYCCDTEWDGVCVDIVEGSGCGVCNDLPYQTSYQVSLTVHDYADHVDTDTTMVNHVSDIVCVPWQIHPNGTEIPHDTWSGKEIRLKGVFFGPQPAAQWTYTWSFGDGSPSVSDTVDDKRAIEAVHAYIGTNGTQFTAELTVEDNEGTVYSDTYPLTIRDRSLEVEVNVAIDEGLWWLHKEQKPNGRWQSYDSYYSSPTASAIHAFEVNFHRPNGSVFEDPYVHTVQLGFDYLFTLLKPESISMGDQCPLGDPDSNGNGLGISVTEDNAPYQLGMVMDAIATSAAPDRVASTGPPGVTGRTYRDILQDMVDMYAWGQASNGGWRYSWNNGADNSVCQWAAIGFLGARVFGLDAPQWVKDENNRWLNATYNGTGFGYTGPGNGIATTPSGMVQLAFCGYDTTDPRWQTAEAYIANNWNWFKTSNNVYAWYAFVKAMRVAVPEPVENLSATGLDWYHSDNGLIWYVLNRQNADGGWPNYYGYVFATAWQIIILSPTLFTLGPEAIAGEDVVRPCGAPVEFDGSGSFHWDDPVYRIVQYEWDFGDGAVHLSTNGITTHVYACQDVDEFPTVYTARLTVTDDAHPVQTDDDTRVVTIIESPHAPMADAGGPYTAWAGVPFSPDGSGSFDPNPGDYIASQEWDIDGSDGYEFDPPDVAVDCIEPPYGCPLTTWTYDAPGTYDIALRVWDSGTLCSNGFCFDPLPSRPAYSVVTVLENGPPQADANGPYEINECQLLELDGAGSEPDPDGNPLYYYWDLDGDGLEDFDEATGVAPVYWWTANEPYSEDKEYTIRLLVSDLGLDDVDTTTVTVYDLTPTISLSGPTRAIVNQSVCFSATASSPCDEIGAIEWDWDYVAPDFDSEDTGTQQCHSWGLPGTYTVAVRVADEDNDEAWATLEIAVDSTSSGLIPLDYTTETTYEHRGYLPETNRHYAEVSLENVGQTDVRGPLYLVFDELEPGGTYVVAPEAVDSNGVLPGTDRPAVDFSSVLGDNVLAQGERTPPTHVIWQIVGDGEQFSFVDVPYALNTAPYFVSDINSNAAEGELYVYRAKAVDPDGQRLFYRLSPTALALGMAIDAASGIVTWRPSQTAAGYHEVVISATDGFPDSVAEQRYVLAVAEVNVPPVITSSPPTLATQQTWYQCDVEAQDADNDALTYGLEIAPAGEVQFDDTTGVFAWLPEEAGRHPIRVRVSDGQGHDVSQSFVVTVVPCNEPPVIDSEPIETAVEGVPYVYQVSARRTDGGPLGEVVYSLRIAPQGMTISETGLITWTPSYTSAGPRTVKVVVSTEIPECMAEDIFQIDVEDRNAAPHIIADASTNATEGALYSYNADAIDPDGDPISYSLVEPIPEGMTIDPLVGLVQWIPSQTAAEENPHTFTVRASDPFGAFDEQTCHLEVDAVDVAPYITSQPVFVAFETELYQYYVKAVDPDGDSLLFEVLGPDGMTCNTYGSTNGLIEWTPGHRAAESSPYEVNVTVRDPAGHAARQDYLLFVEPVNEPPMLVANCPTNGVEGRIYKCTSSSTAGVFAEDEDGDDLWFFLDQAPGGMSIHPLTGEISWLVPQDAAADNPHFVTVKVNDGASTNGVSFQIVVTQVNANPTIYSRPIFEVEAGEYYTYQVLAYDVDHDSLTFSLSVEPPVPGMTIDSDGLITWPDAGPVGEYTVTVDVVDGCGGQAIQTYPLYVQPADDNIPPTITSEPTFTAVVDQPYSYLVVVVDPDNDVPTFSFDQVPSGAAIEPDTGDPFTTLLTWTPTAGQVGTHQFTIRADDGRGAWVTQTWSVNVSLYGPNIPPEIISTPVFTAVVGEPYSYDVEATDEDDEDDELTYYLMSSPAGMSIDLHTGLITWTPTTEDVGTHRVRVQVRDPRGASAWQEYGLTVSEFGDNMSPEILSTPQFAVQVGSLYEYHVEAFDPDGDALTHSLCGGPSGMTNSNGWVRWTPSSLQLGTHEVCVKVTDEHGAWASQTYSLTVWEHEENSPPRIVSTPIFMAQVDVLYTYQVQGIDDDGDDLAYSLTARPSGMTIDSNGLVEWTPTSDQISTHQVTVRVDDNKGGWATQSYPLSVSLHGDNHSPEITSTPTFTATVGEEYLYQVTTFDEDGDQLSFSLDQAPSGASIDETTGLLSWTPVEGQVGVHQFIVRAADPFGGWATQTWTVAVSAPGGTNHAPEIVSTPVFVAQVDTPYVYDVEATDPDGDELTYTLLAFRPGMTIDSNGVIEWLPGEDDLGTHWIEVEARDSYGAWAKQRYTLTVSSGGDNHPPQITSTPTFTATVGQEYVYQAAAFDEDGDTLTFALETAPAGASITSTNGLITWTPLAGQVGVNEFLLRVEDDEGAWASQQWAVTASLYGDNQAPTITSTPIFVAVVDQEYRYDVEADDPDRDQLTYSLTARPAGMQIEASTGLITWTPSQEQVDTHEVVVRVDDGRGGWATQSYVLTVSQYGDNTAPRIVSTPPFTAQVGEVYTYQVVAVDDDGDVLTYSLETSPAGMEMVSTTGLITWTPTAMQTGNHEVNIRVVDGHGGWATQAYIVYVSEFGDNEPPEIISEPVFVATVDEQYKYDVQATDPDGDQLTYSLTAKPAGTQIDDETGLVTWTPEQVHIGTHYITVRVDDGRGGWAGQTYTLTVSEFGDNLSPEITSTPVFTAVVGDLYEYAVDAYDPDGDELTYSLTSQPSAMLIDEQTGVINWTPSEAQVGTHEVVVRVDDGRGGWASQGYTVTVSEFGDNSAPRIVSTPPFRAQVDRLYDYQVQAVDDDGHHLTFSFLTAPLGMNIDPVTGLISWTPSANQVGSHEVGIKVVDPLGAWASQSYTLTVSLVGDNHAPEITSTPPSTAPAGQQYTYRVTAFDEDNETLSFSFDAAPAYATIVPLDETTAMVTWVPVLGQIGAQYFTIRVEDQACAWATQRFAVTVSPLGQNHAPTITSTPPLSVLINETYIYDVEATDPDGDPLTYTLTEAPQEMVIVSTNGMITWMPDVSDLGMQAITVKVTDIHGAWASQSYGLVVSQEHHNTAPRITSSPPLEAMVGDLYTYQVRATDDDPGDTLEYALPPPPSNPHGMTINSTTNGLIEWIPGLHQLGTHAIEVVVSDSYGASATQSFDLTVSTNGTNHAPRIVSDPIRSVVAGMTYEYEIDAVDQDAGDVLTYWLEDGPDGMGIPDSNVGLLEWETTPAHIGTHSVEIHVYDTHDAWDRQVFELEVAANTPPQIVSDPVTRAYVQQDYLYAVQVADPDTLYFDFSLADAPVTMNIDSNGGAITWKPTQNEVGEHDVTVVVRDSFGAEGSQSFTIEVEAPNDFFPPEVVVTVEPDVVNLGQSVTITVGATDDVGVASVELTVTSVDQTVSEVVALDENGRAVWEPPHVDGYVATAVATDYFGSNGVGRADFYVRQPGDYSPPFVEITYPVEYEYTIVDPPQWRTPVIEVPTEITGMVQDDNLFKYTLAYRPVGESVFVTFHTGYGTVANAVLGTIDPTTMVNGLYDVRLQAEDLNGHIRSVFETYSIEGQMKVGNFTISFTDLTVPAAGIPITITRTYDSRVKTKGDFGVGWKLELESLEVEETGVMGEGWVSMPGWLGIVCDIAPNWSHLVSATWPDGRVESFYMTVDYPRPTYCAGGGYALLDVYGVDFEPVYPATSTLQPFGSPPTMFDPFDGILTSSGYFSGIPYEATGYRLTPVDSTEYNFSKVPYSRTAKLSSIRDRNGNTIQFRPDGVIHSAGKSVLFERDAQGRIEKIKLEDDPDNNEILFDYDGRGDLVAVTDRVGRTTRFKYNARHDLIEIIDPRGITPARNIYDDNGRLIAHIDADGNRIEYEHDIDGRMEMVTDRLGNPTFYYYDEDGNVITQQDAQGNVTHHTYDNRGNLLTTTDALGRQSSKTYDSDNNLLTNTDFDGNTTTYTYNDQGQVLTVTNPKGNVSTNEYDANGNLTRAIAPDGSVTQSTYNSAGNLLSTTDPLGHSTHFAYDGAGNLTRQTDPLSHATEYEYDFNGNRTRETRSRTLPDGSAEETVSRFEYDAEGRLTMRLTLVDGVAIGAETEIVYNALGKQEQTIVRDPDSGGDRSTYYDYDLRGNLTKVTHPDDSIEEYGYNREGRRIWVKDRDDHTTVSCYDVLGRVTRTIYAGDTPYAEELCTNPGELPYTQMVYDAIGRVASRIDERGNVTSNGYAPSRQWVVDALGNKTEYFYDGSGNQTRVVDAKGHETHYEYDDNNRQTRTIFQDDTFTRTQYDAAGRKIAETDQAWRTTHFEYDALGRLTTVVDVLGGRTTYAYDEQGNRTTQTDAEGRTTTMEYDALGRMTKRILPLGQEETFAYDAFGNQTRHTDFNGSEINFTYDVNNRLVRKDFPDGGFVEYGYTPSGLRTLAGGDSQAYDERSRLIRETKASGHMLEYAYDDAGNRTRLTTITSNGVVTAVTEFTFDDLNRLEKVIDSNGTTSYTSYTYDAVGNRSTVAYPNGTRARYEYDDLNRLTLLVNEKVSSLEVISSYTYTLGLAGNRVGVVEHDSRTVDYGYDELYRLTRETVTNDPHDKDFTTTYDYDAVGNRLTMMTLNTNGLVTTVYDYDDNDRLLIEERTEESFAEAQAAEQFQRRYASSRTSHYSLIAFMGLTCTALFVPFSLLFPRPPNISRRTRRRRIFVKTIALLVMPCMLLSPDNVVAMHNQAQLYCGMTTAAVGQYNPTPTTYTYGYDNNGNTTSCTEDDVNTNGYDYDFENRLTSADIEFRGIPGTVEYTYDADGIRNSKTYDANTAPPDDDITTYYLTDKNRAYAQVLEEWDGPVDSAATLTVRYVHGDDLIAQTRGPNTHHYHYDGQMSTRQLTWADGTQADTYTYDAFGNLLASSGTIDNSYHYTGEQYDPNAGFYYLRARYYDQCTGRFFGRDIHDGTHNDPRTLHKYLYAGADPVNNWDPSGSRFVAMMVTIVLFSLIVAILVTAVTAAVTWFLGGTVTWGSLYRTFVVSFFGTLLVLGLLTILSPVIAVGIAAAATSLFSSYLEKGTLEGRDFFLAGVTAFFAVLLVGILFASSISFGSLTLTLERFSGAMTTGSFSVIAREGGRAFGQRIAYMLMALMPYNSIICFVKRFFELLAEGAENTTHSERQRAIDELIDTGV